MRLSLLVAAATATRRAMSQEYGQEPTYSSEAPQFTNWTMAIPNIERDFTMECDLHPSIPLGSGPGDTKYNWISFSGGAWNATWGKGTIEVRSCTSSPTSITMAADGFSTAATTTSSSSPTSRPRRRPSTFSRRPTKSPHTLRSSPTGGSRGRWKSCRA